MRFVSSALKSFVDVHMEFNYVMTCVSQRQNERAKLALLSDKLGGETDSGSGNWQSDHLLMMVAYKKWEKILREVSDLLTCNGL